MLSSVGVFLLCIAAGYVTSALLSNLIRLVTGKTISTRTAPKSDFGRALALGVVTFTGPATLFENALAAQAKGEAPKPYLFLSLALVLAWSFLLGLFVVQVWIALTLP